MYMYICMYGCVYEFFLLLCMFAYTYRSKYTYPTTIHYDSVLNNSYNNNNNNSKYK